MENGSKFIIFPPIFFKKYLDLSNGINYDNLLSLKNIIVFMKANEPGFQLNNFI